MTHYLLVFLAGLAGSLHCIGMCGGFACALGADGRGRAATLGRHLLYNLGRVTTYCFLGAVLGHLGLLLVGHAGEATVASLAQRALALVAGLLMVWAGLQFFGRFRRWSRPGTGGELLAQALRALLRSPGPGAPLALGVANGFLPCPLVYAFAAQAAASGGALPGLLTMAAFGVGTFPALLLMGGLGTWLRGRGALPGAAPVAAVGRPGAVEGSWRLHGVRIAGAFLIALGLITFARGIVPLTAHLHGQ